ncbi:hypothetical protein XENORESO_008846, partial [Xenotaenia resolanae]
DPSLLGFVSPPELNTGSRFVTWLLRLVGEELEGNPHVNWITMLRRWLHTGLLGSIQKSPHCA